ncbi:MAG: LuxR C-terminal-related transcriptional regulator [Haloechinothrix sp.]
MRGLQTMERTRPPLHQRLEELVKRVRLQAGLDATFGGEVGQDGFVIDCTAGDRMQSLVNLNIQVGAGLGGKALVLARPVSVADYPHAGGITHHYDQAVSAAGLRSVFAIPVMPSGAPRAIIYGALRNPVPISDMRLSIVHRSIKQFEFDLRVQDEVERSLAELDAEASMARMREELRDIYAETRAIADKITDPLLRTRIESLCERARSNSVAGEPRIVLPSSPLTKRELDVAVQVSAGHTNGEVAERLGLLPSTVKSYLKSAMRKLGVRNRMEFVTECRRTGLIP